MTTYGEVLKAMLTREEYAVVLQSNAGAMSCSIAGIDTLSLLILTLSWPSRHYAEMCMLSRKYRGIPIELKPFWLTLKERV